MIIITIKIIFIINIIIIIIIIIIIHSFNFIIMFKLTDLVLYQYLSI